MSNDRIGFKPTPPRPDMDAVGIFLLLLWAGAVLGPIYWALRNHALVSLGLVLGLLFGYIVQMIWLYSGNLYLIDDLWMRPSDVFGRGFYTTITAGFLHNPFSAMHVLSNLVIIALVGIPLEKRLGSTRWIIIYMIGLFGGSISWTIANLGSDTPSLGASGAAFGILGAYLAGWPRDEVYFPLIIIRPWPVSLIALFYFAIEVVRTWQTVGLSEPSHVAHLAHIGGFIFTYLTLNRVARDGPVAPGESGSRNQPLSELPKEHPFIDVDELLKRLYEEGDERETRQAWMEEIADKANCPVCSGPLELKRLRLKCKASGLHLHWP